MKEEDDYGGGKIDWTIAIVLSIAFHAAVLGSVWMFSDKPAGGDGSPAHESPEPSVQRRESDRAEPVSPISDTAEQTVRTESTPEQSHADSAVPENPSTENPPPDGPKIGTYVVKKGDFLSRIANKCNCTVAELKQLNGIKDANSIHPGQRLKVPVQE